VRLQRDGSDVCLRRRFGQDESGDPSAHLGGGF
jgi:hypothetical protein